VSYVRYVIGCDEVGLGAWAGPLYVCAFAVPEQWEMRGLNDSKKLDTKDRAKLFGYLHTLPLALVRAGADVIDQKGIRPILVQSHTLAVQTLLQKYPDAVVIVDGIVPLPQVPQAQLVPKADAKYPAVMAASVVAKHSRDVEMQRMHELYPDWGFDTGVGYGTKKNREGLATFGMSPIHRRSYEPMKGMRG
jgi:ribonuclease HII